MNKRLFNTLDGENIFFKSVTTDDVLEIHKFASNEKVSKFIGWNLTYSLEETLEIIEDMIEKESAGTGLYASIVLKSTGIVIGTCMIFNFNFQAKHAEIGYVLNANYWNMGYGTEVISMMNDYALKSLRLHKLHARVVDANIGSSKILERNGFLQEGCLKDYYFIDEEYYDGLVFGKILG